MTIPELLPMNVIHRRPRPDRPSPGRRSAGFTLVEIMIVVLIIGILVSIAVPNWVQARTSSRKVSCIGNLKRIESAKEQWTMDLKKAEGAACVMTDLVPSYIKSTPGCPTSGTYAPNAVGASPTCTIAGHILN